MLKIITALYNINIGSLKHQCDRFSSASAQCLGIVALMLEDDLNLSCPSESKLETIA